MAAKYYVKEPAYYGKFQCMGNGCPNDCCHGWRIEWKKDEVERLRAADCSEELKKIIDSGFKEKPNNTKTYVINNNDEEVCPFLENGLCRIQKELGEEYLSKTCQLYPRHAWRVEDYVARTCNTSCYKVLDFLCSDENCTEVLLKALPKNKFIYVVKCSEEKIINNPALKFFGEISEFLINIVSDKTRSLETSLVLGAVAAKIIDRNADAGKANEIPKLLKSLAPQMKDPVQIEKLENVKPNYSIKFGFGQKFMEIVNEKTIENIVFDTSLKVRYRITDFILTLVDEDTNEISTERYIEGKNKFLTAFSEREFVIRNIALNMFMENEMPFKDKDHSIYDNYCCFAAQVAVIDLIAAAAGLEGETNEDIENAFKMKVAIVCRKLCHNATYLENTINIMTQYNCTSPAHLAYILK